eukprot:TRINITY_DN66736_c4_g1_i1.p1 TRINITY_DN66736_c4_g1~~TRINITY_DN66736_c4_g1_i1.p1  ORF type:complete len:1435 (+),score=915.85 TRINITY_DN66736_c4_g1_i1:78-4382(+)
MSDSESDVPVDEDEMASVRQLFDSLDSDGDGVLNHDDLAAALPDVEEERLQSIIDQLDMTGNGQLTFDEFYNGFDIFMGGGQAEDEEENSIIAEMDDSDNDDDDGKSSTTSSLLDVTEEAEEDVSSATDDDDDDDDEDDDDDDDDDVGGAGQADDAEEVVSNNSRSRRTRSRVGTLDEERNIRRIFEDLDHDSDGMVTLKDLRFKFPDSDDQQLLAIIAQMDQSNSGSITFAEFRSGFDFFVGFKPSKHQALRDAVGGQQTKIDTEREAMDKDTEISMLRERVRKLEDREREQKRRQRLVEGEGARVEQENNVLQAEIDELKMRLQHQQAESRELDQTNITLKKMIKSLQTREIALRNQVQETEHESRNHAAELEIERSQRQLKEQALSEMRQQLQGLKESRSNERRVGLRQKLFRMKGIMAQHRAKAKLAEREAELETCRKVILNLQQKVQGFETREDELREMIVALQFEVERLKQEALAGSAMSLADEMASIGAQLTVDQLEEQRRAAEEAERKRKAAEAEAERRRKAAEQEAERKRKAAEEEEARRKKAEAEEAERKKKLNMQWWERMEKSRGSKVALSRDRSSTALHTSASKPTLNTKTLARKDRAQELLNRMKKHGTLMKSSKRSHKHGMSMGTMSFNMMPSRNRSATHLTPKSSARMRKTLPRNNIPTISETSTSNPGTPIKRKTVRRGALLRKTTSAGSLYKTARGSVKVSSESELGLLKLGHKRRLEEELRKKTELKNKVKELLNQVRQLKADKAADAETIKKLEARIAELEDLVAKLQALIAELRRKHAQQQEEERRRIEEENRKREIERKRREEEARQIRLAPEQQAELSAYAKYFNHCIGDDPDLAYIMPLKPRSSDLLNKIRDGWLIAKFVNYTEENAIDCRALTQNSDLGIEDHARVENMTLAIESCRAIGVKVLDVTPSELIESHKNPDVAIGFLWHLIENQLLGHIGVRSHPELVRLLKDGEETTVLMKMSPSEIMDRWLRYHIRGALDDPELKDVLDAGNEELMAKLSLDSSGSGVFANIKDSAAVLGVLLHRVSPALLPKETLTTLLAASGDYNSCKTVLDVAAKLGVQVDSLFVTPDTLATTGEWVGRLNLAFSASIFAHCNGLDSLTEDEMEKAELMDDDDDAGDSREERAFRMWINSMNLEEAPGERLYLHNLFAEAKDGIVLLRVMDKIKAGCVNWKKVELKANNKFKKVANCNYVIDLGKGEFKFALVNIGGLDILNGNKKLTLSLIWQLMHYHICEFLRQVHVKKFGSAKPSAASSADTALPPSAFRAKRKSVFGAASGSSADKDSDSLILNWANTRVRDLSKDQQALAKRRLRGGPYDYPYAPMRSFQDSSLSDSLFFMHLLWAIEPRIVDWRLVTEGKTPEDKLLNARYAISVARKLGATLFVLPDDLVEVKPKMVVTFVGSILALDDK